MASRGTSVGWRLSGGEGQIAYEGDDDPASLRAKADRHTDALRQACDIEAGGWLQVVEVGRG
jgi:hypothetical protein